MEVIIHRTYEEMSRAAALAVADVMNAKPNAVIGMATGSFASIAVPDTRSETRAKRNASSTAGGQCGQVGVTKTSSARSRSSCSSAASESGRSVGSSRPASTIAPTSEPSS